MNHVQLIQLLNENGFTSGWEMMGDVLTVWEHDEEPPTPLVRPQTLEPVVVEPVLDESTEPLNTDG